ncbi:MAG TPA: DUF371 domain-containing protein [Candidatus Bathyarchaeia archaeon]|nr:DUF371 domain-containing protein [Candidatus Bathyarchaeia archaeon]
MPEETETITAYGHENIQATHTTTLEITKDKHLTKNGDCIIAIAANKSLADLSSKFKETLRVKNATLTIRIEAGGMVEEIKASGSSHLGLTHPTEIVVRKSDYISNRTLAIRADKASYDLSKKLVDKLKNPNQKVKITLTAKS